MAKKNKAPVFFRLFLEGKAESERGGNSKLKDEELK